MRTAGMLLVASSLLLGLYSATPDIYRCHTGRVNFTTPGLHYNNEEWKLITESGLACAMEFSQEEGQPPILTGLITLDRDGCTIFSNDETGFVRVRCYCRYDMCNSIEWFEERLLEMNSQVWETEEQEVITWAKIFVHKAAAKNSVSYTSVSITPLLALVLIFLYL